MTAWAMWNATWMENPRFQENALPTRFAAVEGVQLVRDFEYDIMHGIIKNESIFLSNFKIAL